jgi:hypothetical protein
MFPFSNWSVRIIILVLNWTKTITLTIQNKYDRLSSIQANKSNAWELYIYGGCFPFVVPIYIQRSDGRLASRHTWWHGSWSFKLQLTRSVLYQRRDRWEIEFPIPWVRHQGYDSSWDLTGGLLGGRGNLLLHGKIPWAHTRHRGIEPRRLRC